MTRKTILEVQHLYKSFGQFTAVQDVSFSLQQGEIVGLLGPNGAGKTTTIQMLLGLMSPTSGNISYFGLSLEKNREKILQRINHCSGYGKLPPRLSVEENLQVYRWLYNVKNYEKKVLELGNTLQASHLFPKRTLDLSSGENTRILLIKAFLNDPELLLLDEPTSSLDPDIATKIRSFILEEKKKRNLSILITSHNMAEMEEMCDRIIFLHQGKILTIDTPQNLAKQRKDSEIHLLVLSGEKELHALIQKHNYFAEKRKNILVIHLPESNISKFLSEVGKNDVEYSEIEVIHPSLEDFFLSVSTKG
ncbi:MAG: ABC transporter ATP-binding protein [Chlamydiota bacterium]